MTMLANLYSKIVVLLLLFTQGTQVASAQTNYFEPIPTGRMRLDAAVTKHIKKQVFYQLKESELRAYLTKAPLEFTTNKASVPLQMPLPDGTQETFAMYESPVLAPQLAAKHPEIKTYAGHGQTNPSHTIRIGFTSQGFNALILGLNTNAAYYDKVSGDTADRRYRIYYASDAQKPAFTKAFGQSNKCGTLDAPAKLAQPPGKSANGGRRAASATDVGNVLRTFRFAVAADAEFTALYGGNANAAYAGLVGYVNRLNAAYRRELSVALMLVSDVTVVYTNPATDPYTNDDQAMMLTENQANLDLAIGSANYDIGHVLGYAGSSGGGIAIRPSVCDNSVKGQGVSGVGDGSYAPIFDDVLFAHERGISSICHIATTAASRYVPPALRKPPWSPVRELLL